MKCLKKSTQRVTSREVEFGYSYPIFSNNSIRTSKYNLLTFLPLNLIEQFSKAPNVYFLVLTILQFFKPISITGGVPTILPTLLIVIMVSAFKDFLEDYKRWKSDKEENNRKVVRYSFKQLGKLNFRS